MYEPDQCSELQQDDFDYDCFYSLAQKNWHISDLIGALEKIRQKSTLEREGLTNFHKQYLLMVLANKQLEDMIHYLPDITSVASLKTKLSIDKKQKKGIHFCLEKLLKQEISNHRDIIYNLFNSEYRRQPELPKDEKGSVLIIETPFELSAEQLTKLEHKARSITECPYLRIHQIKLGSMTLFLKGSQVACEQILALYNEGLLTDILNIPIEKVEIIPDEVVLNQWFENIFTIDWHSVEQLMISEQLSLLPTSESVQRGKRISLKRDSIVHKVILLINLVHVTEEIIINLKLLSFDGNTPLPFGLKLMIAIEEKIISEILVKDKTSRYIDCEKFQLKIGDRFIVKLILNELEIMEEFIV